MSHQEQGPPPPYTVNVGTLPQYHPQPGPAETTVDIGQPPPGTQGYYPPPPNYYQHHHQHAVPVVVQVQQHGDCPSCRVGWLTVGPTCMTLLMIVLGIFFIFPFFFVCCTLQTRCSHCGARFSGC